MNRRTLVSGVVGAACAPLFEKSAAFSAPAARFGFTQICADGNRFIDGTGQFPTVQQTRIQLDFEPEWIVSAPIPESDAAAWIIRSFDGTTAGFSIDSSGRASPISVESANHGPPVIAEAGDPSVLLSVPIELHPSTLSAPASNGQSTVFVTQTGELASVVAGNAFVLDQQVLPDTRILVDDRGRYLALAGPSADRYRHGVLGDDLEATAFDIIDGPDLAKFGLDSPDVIESNSAIWIDIDGTGSREIIVPVSRNGDGAKIVAQEEGLAARATGTGFGTGSRWRHPIAAGPFGPDGEVEIAAVRTPHIGGFVEFYRRVDRDLIIAAELEGFSSHVLGSRNLDMAVSGDFDGDGQPELVIPFQNFLRLAGIAHVEESMAAELWSLDLPGRLTTNLSAVASNGSMQLGAGTETGTLNIWLSAQ